MQSLTPCVPLPPPARRKQSQLSDAYNVDVTDAADTATGATTATMGRSHRGQRSRHAASRARRRPVPKRWKRTKAQSKSKHARSSGRVALEEAEGSAHMVATLRARYVG